MLGHERGNHPRHERQAHRRRTGDLQRAALEAANVLRRARNALDPDQRALYFLIQRHGFGGRLQTPLDPVEQGKADVFLEAGNQSRRRRLRDVQHFRGAGDGLAEDHCPERFELTQIHSFIP